LSLPEALSPLPVASPFEVSLLMLRRLCVLLACSLLVLASSARRVWAQEAVTITGRVFSASMPLSGASVQVPELDLGTTTDDAGRYSLIVPSTRVRGQTVTLVARYLRHRPEAVRIALVGGSLVQNFVLRSSDVPIARDDRAPTAGAAPSGRESERAGPSAAPGIAPEVTERARTLLEGSGPTVSSMAFVDVAGSPDLPSVLAGRLPGVEVQSAATPGGSSALTVRGAHSITGLTQPLFVLNGIPLDNATGTTTDQRQGRGGFDYGSTIADLNPEDIWTVQLVRGPAAAYRYGGRAANGVLLVTTRSGRGLNGFDISASQQLAFESPLKLPSYQNAYGQGLGGRFSFFDGKGGGVNDTVSQSWGPALLGQPLPQASLTEAARAEVRSWLGQPDNVRDYFGRGRTLATNAAAQGANETGQFRVSLSNRLTRGLTPQHSLTQRAVTLTAGAQPSPQLGLRGDVQYYASKGENRPGSGFDESNPVSVFSLMGRQVDVSTLRNHLRDAAGNQISWHYRGHNNPYFAALENANQDRRSRWLGGGALTYGFSPWLQGNAHLGTDRYHDVRDFSVASGWMGGFPYSGGRGDFSSGGFQTEEITATRTNADVSLRAIAHESNAGALAFTLGAGRHGEELRSSVTAADKLPARTPATPDDWQADGHTNVLFGAVDATLSDVASFSVSTRRESSALLAAGAAQLYPAVLVSVDLARASSALASSGSLDALRIRGGWSRSGNGTTPALLRQLGLTGTALTSAVVDKLAAPEITSSWDVGTEVRMLGGRLELDLTYYNERSHNLLLPGPAGSFARAGVLSNKGLEARIGAVPIRLPGSAEWRIGLSYGKNTNLIESLADSVAAISLAPPFNGVSTQARPGAALGAIVGMGFLRDATGALLLRGGRPLPDTVAGPRVLGTTAPSWIAGLETGVRLGALDLSILFDIRRGGRLFSATNMMGAYAGVLEETAFRPDSGLLIEGTDVATGRPNTIRVAAEDYFHSLRAIGERWVYDAGFVKLRQARLSVALPLHLVGALHAQSIRLSLIGRNLALWSTVPNVDPETILSTSTFRGAEMGQLPAVRSIGVQLSLTP
jgi:hypothetical protein